MRLFPIAIFESLKALHRPGAHFTHFAVKALFVTVVKVDIVRSNMWLDGCAGKCVHALSLSIDRL